MVISNNGVKASILSSPFQFREGGEEGKQPLLLPGDGRLLRVTLAQQGRVLNTENMFSDSLPRL